MKPTRPIVPTVSALVCTMLLLASGQAAHAQPSFSPSLDHTLAIRADGTLWVWGTNADLDGVVSAPDGARLRPGQIGADSDWESASAWRLASYAIKRDGTLWAWGAPAWAPTDDCTTPPMTSTGLARVGAESDWKQVVAQWGFTVALKRDGTLWRWGSWYPGASGYYPERCGQQQIGSARDWAFVTANEDGSILALKVDGTLWAWGRNTRGTLGLGEEYLRVLVLEPLRVGTDRWLEVDAGSYFTLARRIDGTLWGWGWNSAGQLGPWPDPGYPETVTFRTSPIEVSAERDWVAIGAGGEHGLAVKANGSLWTWGRNSEGQCGTGTREYTLPMTRVGKDNDWKSVVGGSHSSFAAKSNGDGYSWGYGALGLGVPFASTEPAPVLDPGPWRSVDVGGAATYGVRADGTLWSWGLDHNGKLGLAVPGDRAVPAQIGSAATWLAVDGGPVHAVALDAAGELWSWGENYWGELGRGAGVEGEIFATPGLVEEPGPWVAVSAGYRHNLALKRDGTLWVWGRNSEGQLGIGQDADPNLGHPRPVQLGVDEDWKQVSAGMYYSLAVKTDGSLWGWGDADRTAYSAASYLPVRIGADNDWDAAWTGRGHRMALKRDGSLWAWKLMPTDPLDPDAGLPVLMPQPSGKEGIPWISASPGEDVGSGAANPGYSVLADGTLWRWSATPAGVPVNQTACDGCAPAAQVGADTDWRAVTMGWGNGGWSAPHHLALKDDGSLSAWGGTTYGQLGTGESGIQYTPRLVLENPDKLSAPPPVTLLEPARVVGTTSPRFAWDAVPGADAYLLWIGTGSTTRFAAWYPPGQAGCATAPGTCALTPPVTLAPGQWYCNVKARSGAATGPWAAARAFTVAILPPAPALVSPAGIIGTAAPTYVWKALPGADAYQLWVGTGSATRSSVWYPAAAAGCANGAGDCSVTPAAALAEGAWYFNVRGRNAAGVGPWGTAKGFVFTAAPPPTKVTLSSTSGPAGTSTPAFTWVHQGGVDSYQLWVGTASTTALSVWLPAGSLGCGSGTCTAAPANPLAAGGWYFNVRGRNVAGTGPWTAAMRFSAP